MKKWMLTVGLVLAAVAVISACGTSENAPAEASNAGNGTVKEFTIDATNFEFDLKEICSIFCGAGNGDMTGKLIVEA